MKYIFLVFCMLHCAGKCFSQTPMDTTRLAVFGKLSPDQLRLADSLLIAAVGHYNEKVSARPKLFMLDETEYTAFRQLEASQNTLYAYLNAKEKQRKLKLLFTSRAKRTAVRGLISDRDSIASQISRLEQTNWNRRDSIVSIWGSGDFIDLPDYYRQYQVYTSPFGKTSIRAACICSEIVETIPKGKTGSLWKTRMITVHDGGSCYFTISLDLEKRGAKWMEVNGF